MGKMTDKQRVLTHLRRQSGEVRTANVSNATGVPHASVRRLLNELRAEGHVTRGGIHGSWVSMTEEIAEPVASVDTDTSIVTGDDVLDSLDVNAREDAPEPVANIFKVECEGDTLYVLAIDEDDAYAQLNAALTNPADPLPRDIITFTQVDELPEGEQLFTLEADEPQSEEDAALQEQADYDNLQRGTPQSDDPPTDEIQ